MDTLTDPPAIASGYGSARWRSAGYWLATVAVGLLAVLTVLTALSWALRPPSRRTPRPMW